MNLLIPSMTCQRHSLLPVLLPQPHRNRLHRFLYAIITNRRVFTVSNNFNKNVATREAIKKW